MKQKLRAILNAGYQGAFRQKFRHTSAFLSLLLFSFFLASAAMARPRETYSPCRVTLSQIALVTPSFAKRGLRKYNNFLAETPDADSDKLVQFVSDSVREGRGNIVFAEKLHPEDPTDSTLKRSIAGIAQFNPNGTAVFAIESINSNGIKHKRNKNDNTTLKIIYGLQLGLAGRPDLKSIELRITNIVNKKFGRAIKKWGFVKTDRRELSLFLDRDSN